MRTFLFPLVIGALWLAPAYAEQVSVDCGAPCTVNVIEKEPMTPPDPDPVWEHVIEDQVLFDTLRLDGPSWNNTLVRNVVILDASASGIYLRDVENVRIEGVLIRGTGLKGIQLSSRGGTRNVTIIGCTILNTTTDGISAGRGPDDAVDHPGLRIIGNTIRNTGRNLAHGQHGLYIQSSDFLIEGNMILDTNQGNGISVRSSGIVRNNIVIDVERPLSGGAKGIGYYSNHTAGPSDTLVIEDNLIDQTTISGHSAAAIKLLRPASNEPAGPSGRVHTFVITGNRIITDGEAPKIEIDKAWLEPSYRVELGENPVLERP